MGNKKGKQALTPDKYASDIAEGIYQLLINGNSILKNYMIKPANEKLELLKEKEGAGEVLRLQLMCPFLNYCISCTSRRLNCNFLYRGIISFSKT